MRISQFAERSGVPATTLRYYEAEGLLPAERTPSGYRIYRVEALERLAFIVAAKHLGLALEEIRELLTVWQDGPCSQVRAALRPMITARLRDAEHRAAQLEVFAASLRDALARLDALPDRHTSCDPSCPFLTGQTMPDPTSADHWRQALDGASRTPVPGGWRFILPAGRAPAVAELAVAEQTRHPALNIGLHLHAPHLHLEITTNPGHNDLIDELLGTTSHPPPETPRTNQDH
ncbi:MerR family transcriptional regulator [Actinocorallia sp. API 0066]|uniref:MerR family transcriptional regulator n=1 Tax=Actinocorallia sp. API 0066 TaxID=2896846 RepID=UPI001E4569EC|nr:MerR family transcriptional regulator [Actinocorallia sp. API 0066]MCD0449062.1 MerR family transcriptional regulator [Actinocorallia sp. API 0066]